jgi:hypothetical protein
MKPSWNFQEGFFLVWVGQVGAGFDVVGLGEVVVIKPMKQIYDEVLFDLLVKLLEKPEAIT